MARGQAASGAIVLVGCAISMLASQSVEAQPYPSPPPPPPLRGLAKPVMPLGSPGAWVTTNDYPAAALRNHEEGTTTFRLAISPEGRVSECTIVSSSGSAALDEATCLLISRRAIFQPALDRNGKATTGTYTNRVRWLVPNGPAMPLQIKPEIVEVSFVIEPDGSASNCVKTVNGVRNYDQTQSDPCATGVRFAPFADAKGKAIRKQVTFQSVLKVSDAPK